MEEDEENRPVPSGRAKSSSTLATERLLAAKGLSGNDEEEAKGFVLSPHNKYYVKWCLFTTCMALLMAVIDPLHLAFGPPDGFYPYNDFWAAMEYIVLIVFTTDMAFKCFVAYDDPERGMVYEPKLILLNYLKFWFWVDFLTTLPIESIAIAGAGGPDCEGNTCLFLGLIRWMKLARLYRIITFFEFLDRKMVFGQVVLTLMRTTTVLFYVVHWMACVFYFVARAEGLSESSWAGSVDTVVESPGWARYFFSLYFSFVIFTGFGDNEFFDQNVVETFIATAYLLVSVLLQAYILGSITTVMVSDDERSNTYRERVEYLDAFSKQKELPEDLHELMRDHLELLHHTEDTSDQLILHRYPPTLRKKVLRHLYLSIFRGCYLFKGCKARFLDEVIGMARMEIFNPHMEVLIEGEVVSELFVLVEGVVHGAKSTSSAAKERKTAKKRSKSMSLLGGGGLMDAGSSKTLEGSTQHDTSASMRGMSFRGGEGASSLHAKGASFSRMSFKDEGASASRKEGSLRFNDGSARHSNPGDVSMRRSHTGTFQGGAFNPLDMDVGAAGIAKYGSSQCFGEFSFFTDGPCLQNYWTHSLTRVLILSKSQLNDLTERHPKQVKQMYDNLKQHVDEKFRLIIAESLALQYESVNNALAGSQRFQPSHSTGSEDKVPLSGEESELLQGALAGFESLSSPAVQMPLHRLKGLMTADERCTLEFWQKARDIVFEYIREKDQQNIYAIIAAAAEADIAMVKKLVAWGVSPGSADYDKRTALMVASHENNVVVVKYLLDAGAPPNDMDAFGITAMYEAVRMGNAEVVEVLQSYDAKLGMDEDKVVGIISEAIVAGDLVQLQWLLRVGVEATWGDYDGRTPLHVAAAEGNFSAVEVLVDEGNACVDAFDRFNRTPADFARKAGNQAIAEYLDNIQKEANRMTWTETKWYLRWRRARTRPESGAFSNASRGPSFNSGYL